ncbi:unnamed protein product, partial [Mesorhabditis spiculigera]
MSSDAFQGWIEAQLSVIRDELKTYNEQKQKTPDLTKLSYQDFVHIRDALLLFESSLTQAVDAIKSTISEWQQFIEKQRSAEQKTLLENQKLYFEKSQVFATIQTTLPVLAEIKRAKLKVSQQLAAFESSSEEDAKSTASSKPNSQASQAAPVPAPLSSASNSTPLPPGSLPGSQASSRPSTPIAATRPGTPPPSATTAPTTAPTAAVATSLPTQITIVQHDPVRATELPKFDGSFQNWPTYKEAIEHLIEPASISPARKFALIRQSVSGTALSMIQDLPLTDASYQLAVESLKKAYELPGRLADELRHSLVNLKLEHEPGLAAKPSDSFILLNRLQGLHLRLQSYDTTVSSEIYAQLIREKFSKKFQARVFKDKTQASVPGTLASLRSAIQEEMNLDAAMNQSRPALPSSENNYHIVHGHNRRQPFAQPPRQAPVIQPNTANPAHRGQQPRFGRQTPAAICIFHPNQHSHTTRDSENFSRTPNKEPFSRAAKWTPQKVRSDRASVSGNQILQRLEIVLWKTSIRVAPWAAS